MIQTTPKGFIGRLQNAGRISPGASSFPLASAVIEDEAGDTFRLRLIADDSNKAGTLAHLAYSIKQQKHEQLFADAWNHKHVLVIAKLSRQDLSQLITWLETKNILPPDSVTHHTSSGKHDFKDILKRDSLKWSGRFAMAASTAVAIAGLGQKDWNRVFTGLGFMAADSIVAVYGNGKGSIDFDCLFRDMHHHFEENNIHLPQIATPEERNNAVQTVQRFIATHPVELNYSLGMLGGLGHFRSGISDFGRSGAGISRMAKGLLGAGGSAAVVFLDEDTARKDNIKTIGHYITHPLEIPQGITDFVLASPIRFKGLISSVYSALYLTDSLEEKKKMKLWAEQQGGLYQGKNISTLRTELGATISSDAMRTMHIDAIEQAGELRKGIAELERREQLAKTFFGGKVTPYLSAFTGLCYISSSLLAAASSKNRDPSYRQADEYERMYAMAAQTLLGVPKEDRAEALNQIATYLSSQKDVKQGETSVPQIIGEVSERMELLEQSPWLPVRNQERQL